ncbi:outer membrane beta-barrel protein [Fulvivirga lutimaris]|uniref:outer membrane beta-barrel protein n=1 Tax=Fulvivirga lutimaris TaxID=1819566 RepID=UPI001624CC28|nr:outer membrane beta-barrel protein [Fulvivirga lutimaris]
MKKHVTNMIKVNKLLLLFLAIITLGALESNAQTACTQTLRTARTKFDQGLIHEMEGLLEACLKKGFTSQERTEAYRLLILSYIYLDETEKADETMLALLKDNHNFAINPEADPAELINLYNTFRTNPIFRIGGKMGANFSSANLVSTGGLNNLNIETSGNDIEYGPKLGFLLGVVADVPINNLLTLNSELGFSIVNFESTSNLYYNIDGNVASNNILLESQNWAGFQTMLQVNPIKSKLNPYISIGGGVDYLITNQVTATREVLNEQPVKENTIDILEARNKLNYYASAGIGIKSKFSNGVLFAEFRFKYGLANLSNSDEILDVAPEYIFDYFGNYNNFSIVTAEFSVGYLVDIYKPKKLRE